jgi:hypothetical protein
VPAAGRPRLIAGTLFEDTKLTLPVWFLAIYLISRARAGSPALALKCHLGVNYPTDWLIHRKLMQAMVEREVGYVHGREVQVDHALLGGELSGGKAGRGFENKMPFLAAVSVEADGPLLPANLGPVAGFTPPAMATMATVPAPT